MKLFLIISGILACLVSMFFALQCMSKNLILFTILSLIGASGGIFLALGLTFNMLEIKK